MALNKEKFDSMAVDGTCNVCGKETKVVCLASSMGPVSWAYCASCCEKGLEPYSNIVAYLSDFDLKDLDPKFADKIRYMLKELGKTEEEFIADCEKMRKEEKCYYDYFHTAFEYDGEEDIDETREL
jgi:glycine cleavage system protein P-like pyridoxal-binding family